MINNRTGTLTLSLLQVLIEHRGVSRLSDYTGTRICFQRVHGLVFLLEIKEIKVCVGDRLLSS